MVLMSISYFTISAPCGTQGQGAGTHVAGFQPRHRRGTWAVILRNRRGSLFSAAEHPEVIQYLLHGVAVKTEVLNTCKLAAMKDS